MSAVMEEKKFRGLREVALLSVIAGALFFLISLLTFNNDDAGWTHSGSVQTISNAGGVFGAWLADFMLSFFGLCAYTFPFIIVWQGYLNYSQKRLEQSHTLMTLQWLGAVTTIVAADALFHFYLLPTGIELPRHSGGILGQEVGTSLAVAFGNSGATLFLLVILFAGLRLITEISLLAVLDFIGKHCFNLSRLFYQGVIKILHKHTPQPALQLVNNAESPVARKKVSVKHNSPSALPLVEETEGTFDELLDDVEGNKPEAEKKTVKKPKTISAPAPLDIVAKSTKPAKIPLSQKFDKLVETVFVTAAFFAGGCVIVSKTLIFSNIC